MSYYRHMSKKKKKFVHPRIEYVPSHKTFGPFSCLEMDKSDLYDTSHDVTLVGSRGEIWEYDENTYKGYTVLPSGQEKIFYCPKKDLKKAARRIEAPLTVSQSLEVANKTASTIE